MLFSSQNNHPSAQARQAGQGSIISQVSLDLVGRPSTSSLINNKIHVAPRTKVGGTSSIISNAMIDRYKNLRREQSRQKSNNNPYYSTVNLALERKTDSQPLNRPTIDMMATTGHARSNASGQKPPKAGASSVKLGQENTRHNHHHTQTQSINTIAINNKKGLQNFHFHSRMKSFG